MHIRFSLALLFSVIISLTKAESIYQYTDKNGTTVYSNKPSKGASKVTLPPITIYASPMTQSDYNAKSYTDKLRQKTKLNPITNYSFATNEFGRNQVLTEELLHEKQALTDSEKALASARQTKLDSDKNNPAQYQSRIQALEDAITEHQKNIVILSQQLGN